MLALSSHHFALASLLLRLKACVTIYGFMCSYRKGRKLRISHLYFIFTFEAVCHVAQTGFQLPL